MTSVVVLADFTAGVFERLLRNDPDADLDVQLIPPDAVMADLLGGPERRDAIAVVWLRAEAALPAVAGVLDGLPVDDEVLAGEVDALAATVGAFAARHRHVLMATFVPPPFDVASGLGAWAVGGIRRAVALANVRLADALGDHPDVQLLDAGSWLAATPSPLSPKQWFAAKVPYSNAVFDAAVADVIAATSAVGTAPRKLLVLDLDDTLWGGVVGDVGWPALRLGGHDHAGEAYRELQRALRSLRRRGVLLAVVSKNDEQVALEAMRSHPEMLVRPEDLAGWRISWDDKAENLRALVEDLGLGMDAVVFVDDNPVERSRIRDAFPDVLVPEWPADPAHAVPALASLRCFDTTTISDEDQRRTELYREERVRRASASPATTFDEWLASLGVVVTVRDVDASTLPRVVQLLNKTNQMNLRTRRTTEAELRSWLDGPNRTMLAFEVEDRFGSSGLTGVIGLDVDGACANVTDLVLSCRVMGRRVELALVHVATARAAAMGAREVCFELVPTDRNMPCAEVLRTSALTERDGLRFVWTDDGGGPHPPPENIDIRDQSSSAPAR